MDPWLLKNLACPRDHAPLQLESGELVCPQGHRYPVVDGVPVMLLDDVPQTMELAHASIRGARSPAGDKLFLDSLGISPEEKKGVLELEARGPAKIDPVVSYLIGATGGIAYKHLIGKLEEYPIPDLRLPPGEGRTLLDIGCNWGRWCLAAARRGYQPIGLDPSLGAIMAARRVARQNVIARGEAANTDVKFVVGDARFLPFRDGALDTVFSYSVLQHLARENVEQTIGEIRRILKQGGTAFVQMPNTFGLRCLYHQARRGFREATGFEVRYSSVPALRALFSRIGVTTVSVDCFFGIGLQRSDLRFMPATHKMAILASECLRAASHMIPPLKYVADSVYVSSIRDADEGAEKINVQQPRFVK